jgi:hypothetical protein
MQKFRFGPGHSFLALIVLYILLPLDLENPEWEIKDIGWAILIAIPIVANCIRWRQLTRLQRQFLALLFLFPLTLIDKVVPSRSRRHLPPGATEIREFYRGNFTGDYFRILKAQMSEAQFQQYASNLNMNQRYADTSESGIPNHWFSNQKEAPWWTPPSDTNHAFVTYEKDAEGRLSFCDLLGYSNGYAYLLSLGM